MAGTTRLAVASGTKTFTALAVLLECRREALALGKPLFSRESHGMELTAQGRAFLDHALTIDVAKSYWPNPDGPCNSQA